MSTNNFFLVSDKSNLPNRRHFFGLSALSNLLHDADAPSDSNDVSLGVVATRREAIVWGRNVMFALGLGKLFWPEVAKAQTATPLPPRFDLLKQLDPFESGNYASGQNSYIYDGHAIGEQPALWLCDDVSRKDKDRIGHDILSPSVVFESMKKVQKSVGSKYGLIRQRLHHLPFIKRTAENYQDEGNEEGEMHRKYLKLMEVYENELELNTELKELWEPIADKLRNLRPRIKSVVMAEREGGKKMKRCAQSQLDIGLNDFIPVIPLHGRTNNPDFQTYPEVPVQFTLEGFRCSEIEEENSVSSSSAFEEVKYLEKIVYIHVKMAAQREEMYLQMELLSKSLSDHRKRTFLATIQKNGRKYNGPVRKKWDTILKEVRELKEMIWEVEQSVVAAAQAINRCEEI